jgi:DivIVA domain-containing protein
MASRQSLGPGQSDSAPSPGVPEPNGATAKLGRLRAEIANVSFPVSVRGYDRRAVDDYVTRVNQAIAESEAMRSPEVAVKHALEQVGKQTGGMLKRAGETVEEIIVSARNEAEESTTRAQTKAEEIVTNANAEADEILARAKAEAEKTAEESRKGAAELQQRTEDEVAALRHEAETQLRELEADTNVVREDRRQLLEDIRGLAARVDELATAADARFPPREHAEPTEAEPKPATEAGSEASDAAPGRKLHEGDSAPPE